MKFLIIISFSLFLYACQFPTDPNNTLKKVQNNELRVGICCASISSYEEKSLVERLANQLNAKIAYTQDTQENLYRKLENFKLDIATCSIDKNSPWKNKIAFSAEINETVFALPPGENAWLKYINRFIQEQKIRKSDVPRD